ncbi:hypothetical protein GALMADRAFT_1299286 [Galerina marginata CBS 339.88]|uniref:Uncharacterized protein n=1 Tax=Galerina marginata (strain CBS 339.88) TaxID=685588 RepID=A0A067T6U3_GALM3|nr:hypothetical protein GALMADRAFT_1299286 [Galerina marginata CBS 339.88]
MRRACRQGSLGMVYIERMHFGVHLTARHTVFPYSEGRYEFGLKDTLLHSFRFDYLLLSEWLAMKFSIGFLTVIHLLTFTTAAPRFSFSSECLPSNCPNDSDCPAPPGCFWEDTGPYCAESCRVGHEREKDLCDGGCCYRIMCCED